MSIQLKAKPTKARRELMEKHLQKSKSKENISLSMNASEYSRKVSTTLSLLDDITSQGKTGSKDRSGFPPFGTA
ncbi:hypothetical protein [Paenibacillus uliginis]|uniref:hypothetical protein n=1 Tax=Paenibacillus uliginis TaxID=683737 RepID=UPI001FCD334E|nr:hypothetical protein [Paenibacillus uliginis]